MPQIKALARTAGKPEDDQSRASARSGASPRCMAASPADAGRAQALLKLEDDPQAFPLARRPGRIRTCDDLRGGRDGMTMSSVIPT